MSDNLVSKSLAYILSIIGHPMLIIMYVFFLYLKVNPYLFPYSSNRELIALTLIIFFTSVLIPIIAILLMMGVGFIKSLEMKERTERIGPLIVVAISYLWLYLNIRTHSAVPIPYANFVLGALIALFLAFFLNNFSKISLHGVGVGGLLMAALHLIIEYGDRYILLDLFGSSVQIHNIVILLIVLVLGGAVLSSRLFLRAHNFQDVAGGFSVGVLGQLIAVLFF